MGGDTLAAGRDISKRVIEKNRERKSDAYRAYTRSNIEYSKRVSRRLVVASEGMERRPEEVTYWVRK